MGHRGGGVSVQTHFAVSPLWPIVGFLSPALTVHASLDGGVSGGLVAIGLYRFDRRLFVIAISRWTIFLILLARDVFVFVAELYVTHDVWREAIVAPAAAFGIFSISSALNCAGSFPLGTGGHHQ